MLVDPAGKPTTEFDCKKPSVIFAHGWTTTGQATDFPTPDKWRRAGFNTFMFRWHRRSFDTEPIPLQAEARIPEVADELLAKVADVRALFPTDMRAKDKRPEIRVVGHSLGGRLVTEMAAKAVMTDGGPPERIELLDPAYIIEMQGTGDMTAVGDKLAMLRDHGVKAVVYSSIVADFFGLGTTWNTVNLQIMAADWTGLFDLVMKHTAIVPYYFDSIDAKVPPVMDSTTPAFSAARATSEIPEVAVHLLQIAGDSTVDIGDDTYQIVK
jgi:hypothetical protein